MYFRMWIFFFFLFFAYFTHVHYISMRMIKYIKPKKFYNKSLIYHVCRFLCILERVSTNRILFGFHSIYGLFCSYIFLTRFTQQQKLCAWRNNKAKCTDTFNYWSVFDKALLFLTQNKNNFSHIVFSIFS